jgi:hypothetical protein
MGRSTARLSGVAAFGCLLIALPLLAVLAPIILVFTWWEDYRTGEMRREFGRRWPGKKGVLVYSNSPHWQAYIETQWMPRLGDRLVVLKWSERTTWNERHPFEARLFRRFGGDREFNPLAVVFVKRPRRATFHEWLRGIRQLDPAGMLAPCVSNVKAIRFWQPFRDFKHGKDRALRAADHELFTVLEAT